MHRLHSTVACSGGIANVTTNSLGYYGFENLPAATYTVTPAKTSYTFNPSAWTVGITASYSATNVNFIGLTASFISGRVTDPSGIAVAGVKIARTGTTATVTTDINGYYGFSAVPAGTYTITPSKTGSTFTPVSQSATVSAGVNAPNVDFTTP